VISEDRWDAVIVGGGPAGCVCAIDLVRRGRRVLLLEAETTPRYHVGESLSPAACSILEACGVVLDRDGFVAKPGATFVWGGPRPFATYYASTTAWQVRRAELDASLLELARVAGAEVRTRCRVTAVTVEGDRATGVLYQDAGQTHQAEADWVVDASGRGAVLARQFGLLAADPDEVTQAMWGYFRDGRPLPGRAAGNSLYIGGRLAAWYIPVDRRLGLVSVGFIGEQAPAGDPEGSYLAALAEAGTVNELLTDAYQVGPIRVADVGRYAVRQLAGPGWLLVGDAAGFVDCIVTPGVQLAAQYGRRAAATIDAALDEPSYGPPLGEEYQRRLARELAAFGRLAGHVSAARVTRPTGVDHGALAGSDEREDRMAFLSLVSGQSVAQLGAGLARYLGMRAASTAYGGRAPVFGEAEGFGYLAWSSRDRGPVPADVVAGTPMRLAEGTGITTQLLVPTATGGEPRTLRALHNRDGDRFLLTKELEVLVHALTDGPTHDLAYRRFASAFDVGIDVDAFDRWLLLLAQHGIVGWRGSPSTSRAEAKV